MTICKTAFPNLDWCNTGSCLVYRSFPLITSCLWFKNSEGRAKGPQFKYLVVGGAALQCMTEAFT